MSSNVRRIREDDDDVNDEDDDDLANALLALVDAGPPQSSSSSSSSAVSLLESATMASTATTNNYESIASDSADMPSTTASAAKETSTHQNKSQRGRLAGIGFSDDEDPHVPQPQQQQPAQHAQHAQPNQSTAASRKRKAGAASDSAARSSAAAARRAKRRPMYYQSTTKYSDDDSDGASASDDYDGLVESGSDRENLESLPELERERILNERAEKRDLMREKRALEKKLRQAGMALYDDAPTPMSSTETPKLSKRQQLELLKDKRVEKQRKSENLDEQSDARNNQPVNQTPSHTDQLSPSQNRRPAAPQELYDITFAEMLKLQLTRNDISRLCFAEFFPTVAQGAFVRVNLGPMPPTNTDNYRIAEIKQLNQVETYYIINGQKVNQSFTLNHGKSERVFTADVFSNSPFTEAEFNRWKIQLAEDDFRPPGRYEVQTKSAEIADSKNYIFSDKEICDMVAKKKAICAPIRNFAAEKVNLLRKQAIAASSGDQSSLDDVSRQLRKLREDSEAARAKVFPESNSRAKARVAQTASASSQPETPAPMDHSQSTSSWEFEKFSSRSSAQESAKSLTTSTRSANVKIDTKYMLSPTRHHANPSQPGPEKYLDPKSEPIKNAPTSSNGETAKSATLGLKSYEELFSAATTNLDLDIDI